MESRTLNGREALIEILSGNTVIELTSVGDGDRPPLTEWEYRLSTPGGAVERRRLPDGRWSGLWSAGEDEVRRFLRSSSQWRTPGEDGYVPFARALRALMEDRAVKCRCDRTRVWLMEKGTLKSTDTRTWAPSPGVPSQAAILLDWCVVSDNEISDIRRGYWGFEKNYPHVMLGDE